MKKVHISLLLVTLIAVLLIAAYEQRAEIKAVYLVPEDGGELPLEALRKHPEIAVIHSNEELTAFTKKKVAVWVDKDALNLVDKAWFTEEPQKFYPIVLVGYGNLEYSFSQIGGFDGGMFDGGDPSQLGYSIWLCFFDRPSLAKAFRKGYSEPPTIQNILDKTNKLLNEDIPEGEDVIVYVFKD